MSEPLEHPHGQEGEEEGEEEWESEDSLESDLDSEAEIAELMQMDDLVDDSASTGKQEYLAKCSELRIVPVAMFIAKLECEHINLRHHGMGVKGARALAAALLANSKIRSLNLGDNWFGDEGVLAVRWGVVGRYRGWMPVGRVQAARLRATPFDRLAGVRHLELIVIGGGKLRLRYLPAADADALLAGLGLRPAPNPRASSRAAASQPV